MSHATHRPRKTVEDYLALPDDVHAELIDGEIYVTPSPSFRHQVVVPRVWQALQRWAREGAGGLTAVAPLDVHLPTADVVQPDVLYVAPENAGIVGRHVHGAPDLVVEVVSQARPERDRIVKRELYARSGVAEYWIVDPEERSVEVLRLDGEAYAPAGFFQGEDTLASPSLSSLRLPLSELFDG